MGDFQIGVGEVSNPIQHQLVGLGAQSRRFKGFTPVTPSTLGPWGAGFTELGLESLALNPEPLGRRVHGIGRGAPQPPLPLNFRPNSSSKSCRLELPGCIFGPGVGGCHQEPFFAKSARNTPFGPVLRLGSGRATKTANCI